MSLVPRPVPSKVAPEEEVELPVVQPVAHTAPGATAIRWTVEGHASLEMVASRWGLTTERLVELNPALQLRGRDVVPEGTRLVVYAPDDERPTRSIGSPNKGKLQHGMPMPEGPHWVLRERRTRAFGASNTIQAMVTAFERYGQAFDGAPPVLVGEISGRRGGRAAPHRSHRTGRDVDLGYILTVPADGTKWRLADAKNFDVEKNWALIRALVDTGEVQQIFISSRLQQLLRPVARAQLSEEEFGRYFHVAGRDPSEPPILKHWDGHRDHMHVRFRCEDGNSRCRSRSQAGRVAS